jgi:opacity protein-like surface antigen
MKHLIILLLLGVPLLLNAQYYKPARLFDRGQMDIQAGLGIFPTYLADRPEIIMPPLQVGARYMVSQYVSLGAFAGYSLSQSREKILHDSIRGRWFNQSYFLGTELGFHYTKIDNWDLYGGLSLLYQYVRLEADNPEFEKAMRQTGIQARRGKATMTAFIGSRFALSDRFTLFAELGYGVSLLKVGIGFKL